METLVQRLQYYTAILKRCNIVGMICAVWAEALSLFDKVEEYINISQAQGMCIWSYLKESVLDVTLTIF